MVILFIEGVGRVVSIYVLGCWNNIKNFMVVFRRWLNFKEVRILFRFFLRIIIVGGVLGEVLVVE